MANKSGNLNTEECLRKEVEELKNLVQSLLKPKEVLDSTYDEDEDDFPFNKIVKVMSYTNNPLTLTTERHGGGVSYIFPKIFEVLPIVYSDLIKIINIHPTFTIEGAFFIMNETVVKKRILTSAYDKFLTKNEMLTILDCDIDEISRLFNKTTKRIQIH